MTHALTHFFGSTDGYRTLARAPGVSDAEDAALASLGFGSPRSQADFDALETQPCMAGRLLPSGRFAITRVFPGKPDVAGRQTVERRTLVLEPHAWAELLASDLGATLTQPHTWKRERFEAGEPIEFEALQGDDLLPEPGDDERRAFDALLEAHATGRCARFPDDARWNRGLLRLGSFLTPDRAIGFGWGVGMWSVPSGVWLATLRADAQARQTFSARLSGAFLHADEVAQLGRGEAGTRQGKRKRPAGAHRRRMPPPWAIGAVLAMLLIALTAWLVFGVQRVPERGASVTTNATPEAPVVVATNPPADAAQPPPPSPSTQQSATTSATNTPPSPTPVSADAPPEATQPQTTSFGSTAATKDVSNGSVGAAEAATPALQPLPTATPNAASPAPTNAPSPPSSNTPAPVERETSSTSWDAEVRLLKESIDLATRAREIAAKGAPDVDATVAVAQDLATLAVKIRAEALKVDRELTASASTGSDRRIFFFDNFQAGKPRAEYGTAKSVDEMIALVTFPPAVARQIALLAARFEIAESAREVLQSSLGAAESVRDVLKPEVSANGWPSARPFEQWFYRVSG
ncbi:MAG: hypothetical protein ACKPEA_12175, partial [Planctomycetota bacterium]